MDPAVWFVYNICYSAFWRHLLRYLNVVVKVEKEYCKKRSYSPFPNDDYKQLICNPSGA
jgi:hypothetical protein